MRHGELKGEECYLRRIGSICCDEYPTGGTSCPDVSYLRARRNKFGRSNDIPSSLDVVVLNLRSTIAVLTPTP